jgi:AMIN domain
MSALAVPARAVAQDAAPVCDQPSATAAAGPNLVSGVKAVPRGQAIDIEVAAGPNPSVKYERLIMPDRLALDINGATMTARENRVLVDTGGVLGVRISQFKTNPPVVRVVADLEEPRRFRIFPCAGRVVMRIFNVKAESKRAALVTPATESAPIHTSAPPRHMPAQDVVPTTAVPAPVVAPPKAPPSRNDIRYDHGMLTIRAENVTLASAIMGVGQALKADIQLPSGTGQEKIFSSIGPAPPEQAIDALLTGSSLNYILVEGQQPGRKMTLVLSARSTIPGQPAPPMEMPGQAPDPMQQSMIPADQNSQDGVEDSVPTGVPEASPEIPEQAQQDSGQQPQDPNQQQDPYQHPSGEVVQQDGNAPPVHGEVLPQQDQPPPQQPQPNAEDQGRNTPP